MCCISEEEERVGVECGVVATLKASELKAKGRRSTNKGWREANTQSDGGGGD